MKKIALALICSLFTACSSVDTNTILIGECRDEPAKMRFEIYLRTLPTSDTSEHLPSIQDHKIFTDEETLDIIKHLSKFSKQRQAEKKRKDETPPHPSPFRSEPENK